MLIIDSEFLHGRAWILGPGAFMGMAHPQR
jgi:hypothetical protein